jgi:hypothetical protein
VTVRWFDGSNPARRASAHLEARWFDGSIRQADTTVMVPTLQSGKAIPRNRVVDACWIWKLLCAVTEAVRCAANVVCPQKIRHNDDGVISLIRMLEGRADTDGVSIL